MKSVLPLENNRDNCDYVNNDAAKFALYPKPEPLSDLTAEAVVSANYSEVLALLDVCFPERDSQESYRISLSHVASGKRCYYSPFVKSEITVVGYYLFRLKGVPAAVTGVHHPSNVAEGEYWIGWTGVAPQFRSGGIGKLIVGWMEDLVRCERGIELNVSTGNTPYYESARALYARAGFAVVPEKSDHLVEDVHSSGAVIYRKRLD